jgi:hypothetical protein
MKTLRILKSIILYLPIILLIISILLYFGYVNLKLPFNGIDVFKDMIYQSKLTPQETTNQKYLDSVLVAPLPNSAPINHTKYAFKQTEYDSAVKRYTNPLLMNDFNIKRGKNRFQIFCVPCHNSDGKGKGLIITQPKLTGSEEGFPPPADLTRTSAILLSDGRLFHILSSGQNLMFPVNYKLDTNDRWAIICYIRFLQNQKN